MKISFPMWATIRFAKGEISNNITLFYPVSFNLSDSDYRAIFVPDLFIFLIPFLRLLLIFSSFIATASWSI